MIDRKLRVGDDVHRCARGWPSRQQQFLSAIGDTCQILGLAEAATRLESHLLTVNRIERYYHYRNVE